MKLLTLLTTTVRTILAHNASEHLRYHIKNGIPICRSTFRPGSPRFFDMVNEARELKRKGLYFCKEDNFILCLENFFR